MGIISGFLGGAGNAMADAGKMLFADKLSKERAEADFLRDSELKKGMATEEREYKSGESEKEREFKSSEGAARDKAALERTQYTADTKAKAAGDKENKPTSQIKNIRFLMSKEGGGNSIEESVQLTFPQATIKHTDPEGNQIVVVKTKDGHKEIGKITTDAKGDQKWLPAGETMEKPITGKDLKTKAAAMSKEEGTDKDWIPFNERGSKDPEVRAALEEERKTKKPGGIVGGAMNTQETPKVPGNGKVAPQKAIDAVMADKKLLPQFIEHYGYDPTKQ